MELGRLLRSPAPVSDRRARGQALGGLLLSGSAFGLIVLTVGRDRGFDGGFPLLMTALALVLGATLLRFPDRLGTRVCHGMVAAGTVAIVASVALVDEVSLAVTLALPLIWVAMYAGHFFAPAAAFAHAGLGLALLSVVLARGDRPAVVELLFLVCVVLVVVGVVGWLARHRALADVDALTGTPNRRGLARLLEATMADTERHRTPLNVALLDIDHFRWVNDVHGRAEGDRLLLACVRRWQLMLPASARLARLGSDEFALLMPGMTTGVASQLLEELRSAMPDGQTCTAGVASWQPGDTQSMLLARADSALYDAKRAGRDRVVVLGDDSGLAEELREAVEHGQLVVHYQPFFALDDGQLEGVEALVRWRHPERGLVPPNVFLPVAEECGAIHAIDRWMLVEACRQVRAWERVAACGESLVVAVNASPTRLRDPRLVDDVRDALDASQLEPERLVLEITEGALEGDLEAAATVLWELRDLGVHLAIDDFGTGHSSLARLRSLPFDVLKIDRSFVSALGAGQGGESLLSAILGMAGSLGLATVAEGVEEVEQLGVLRDHGCVHAQGFLLARPTPAEELGPLLTTLTAPPVAGQAARRPAAVLGELTPERLHRQALEELARPLLAHLAAATGLESTCLTWIDWERGVQRVWLVEGGASVGIEEGHEIPWRESLCRRAFLDGPRATRDLDGDLQDEGGLALRARTYVMAPITLADGRLHGTLRATSRHDRAIEPATQRLVELVACMVADHLDGPLAAGAPSN